LITVYQKTNPSPARFLVPSGFVPQGIGAIPVPQSAPGRIERRPAPGSDAMPIRTMDRHGSIGRIPPIRRLDLGLGGGSARH
jgi:hypothetical protein